MSINKSILPGWMSKAIGLIAKKVLCGSAALIAVTGPVSYAEDQETTISSSVIEEVRSACAKAGAECTGRAGFGSGDNGRR